VSGGADELHALSAPALTLSNGGASSVTVHEVSVVNGQARLVLSTSPTPRVVPVAAPITSLPTALRIAGGTMPYTVLGYATPGVSVAVSGDEIVLSASLGGPLLTLETVVSVMDAAGNASDPVVASSSGSFVWEMEVPDLLGPLLEPATSALTPGQQGYLDVTGNHDGVYDVGDLRKWLRSQAP
jgi:hypothetical protein